MPRRLRRIATERAGRPLHLARRRLFSKSNTVRVILDQLHIDQRGLPSIGARWRDPNHFRRDAPREVFCAATGSAVGPRRAHSFSSRQTGSCHRPVAICSTAAMTCRICISSAASIDLLYHQAAKLGSRRLLACRPRSAMLRTFAEQITGAKLAKAVRNRSSTSEGIPGWFGAGLAQRPRIFAAQMMPCGFAIQVSRQFSPQNSSHPEPTSDCSSFSARFPIILGGRAFFVFW